MSRTGFEGSLQLDFGDWGKVGRVAITLAPVTWTCCEPGREISVEVPPGFMTDGASVPRLLWWFLPPWGDRATFAALVHDYLLDRLQGFVPGGPIADTRAKCDRQFLLALKALRVSTWRAYLAWAGVRAHSIRLQLFGQADKPVAV